MERGDEGQRGRRRNEGEGEEDRRHRSMKCQMARNRFFKYTPALREREEAGTMPFMARGVASPWFTGRAQKPAGGGVWILDGPKLLINSFVVVNS